MLKERRIIRHRRIRKRISGSTERPRLSVFRSHQHIYAQIIDDTKGQTLVAASDMEIEDGKTKVDRAYKVGELIAQKALAKKIKAVVFDRGGFKYHGRVAALAEGARKGGLQF